MFALDPWHKGHDVTNVNDCNNTTAILNMVNR